MLGLLGRGYSNAAIASHLQLTEGTVRNHVSAVLGKLDVSDRTQAALIALRCGLVNKRSDGLEIFPVVVSHTFFAFTTCWSTGRRCPVRLPNKVGVEREPVLSRISAEVLTPLRDSNS